MNNSTTKEFKKRYMDANAQAAGMYRAVEGKAKLKREEQNKTKEKKKQQPSFRPYAASVTVAIAAIEVIVAPGGGVRRGRALEDRLPS